MSFANSRLSQRLREHFNWFAWALAKYLFQSASILGVDKKLPARDAKEWYNGKDQKNVGETDLNGKECLSRL